MRIETTRAFREWLDGLRDLVGRARIQARIGRLASGNPGLHRVLSDGVRELKIDAGPGYRVYDVQRARVTIVLLAGGDKSTQREDIAHAIALARNL
jgi:putative addiction module killer protein